MESSTTYARKSPRIRCHLPVQIQRQGDAAAGVEPVVAQTIDVSRGGIRVEAPLWLAVGEPLVCSMTLDGEDAALHGHVAWSSASGASTGLGISFGELSAQVARRLEDVMRATLPGAEPVELCFEGLPTPIRARAITQPGGIRLATALPVLTRDAGVVFRYGEPQQTYAGHVAGVAIHEREGARILEVDLEVVPQDRRRFRRHAQYGHAPSAPASEPPPPRPARSRSATRPLWQPPPTTGNEPERSTGATPRQRSTAANAAPETAARGPLRHRHSLLLAGAAAAALGAWALVTAPRAPASPAAAATPAMQAARATPAPRTPPAPAPRATGLPTEDIVVGPPAAPSVVPPPTAPIPAAGVGVLQVNERPREAELSLPFEGSLEGLVVTRWTEPHAWVLAFPMARTPLPDGVYRLGSGRLHSLRVQRTAEGLAVRVVANARLPSPRLTQQQDRLVVSFRPAH